MTDWTAAEVAKIERVSPLSQWADVEVTAGLEVRIVRVVRRVRCARCGIRRVVYRIAVDARHLRDGAVTEARCADCWGVRP